MNHACVVDASVALAWIHPSQATAETDDLLIQISDGMDIVVPPIWFLEIANALLVLERRRKITKNERVEALKQFAAFNISVDEDASRFVFTATTDLAEKHNLSLYDASYLELAFRKELPLASRDESLRRAAKAAGVKVVF